MSASTRPPGSEPRARARSFVERCGDRLDRLRLDALEGGPAEPARAELEAGQRGDGSFPPRPGRGAADPVAATAEGLEVLGQLQVRRAPSVEAAVGWLARAQAPDGSWAEATGARSAERIALTGRVGGLLGRSVYVRPEALAAAGDWLARHFDPGLVEGGDEAAVARLTGLAAFFANTPHGDGDAVLQWCGRALEKGFRGGGLGGLGAARVLDACDAVALPGARVAPGEVVLALLAEQEADGGWPGPDPAARVAATLDALRALARLPA